MIGRGLAATALALIVMQGAACSSPFGSDPDDYARQVALSRLREIRTTRLEEHEAARRAVAQSDGSMDAIVAETQQDPKTPDERAAAIAPVAPLSLEESRASALAHNLDLKVAVIDPAIARETVNAEEAAFEKVFTLSASWRELDTPTASDLSSSSLSQQAIEPGVRIPLRTGGTASIGLPIVRSEDNNSFSTLNPAYSSDLVFSISQPLLRGAGRRVATGSLRIAGYEAQASEARTKLEVIRQIAAVDRAYWRLFEARQVLEVAQQQLELAQAQRDRAKRQVDAEVLPEVELLRAESGAAERLDAILQAKSDVLQRQRELKRLISLPELAVNGQEMILPTSPPDPVEYAFDSQALVAQALDERMEMLELELAIAADAVRVMLDRDATLPLLTLDYTYRVNGLGRSVNRSLDTLSDNHFEDWEVGLAAEVPIGNEQARSRLRASLLQRLQRLQTREARAQSIQTEVLNAIDSLDAAWQRILAARQSVVLNTRTYQAEQRQFGVGRTTSTDVLDAAARLAEAQLAEVRALTDYQISQVDLAFATGTLLGAAKVEWAPSPAPDLDADPAQRGLERLFPREQDDPSARALPTRETSEPAAD
jgi:outer membrane protein